MLTEAVFPRFAVLPFGPASVMAYARTREDAVRGVGDDGPHGIGAEIYTKNESFTLFPASCHLLLSAQ